MKDAELEMTSPRSECATVSVKVRAPKAPFGFLHLVIYIGCNQSLTPTATGHNSRLFGYLWRQVTYA